MTLDIRPDIAEGLEALAAAQGISVQDYLKKLVERELPGPRADNILTADESGMVLDNGLLVYKTGKPLPAIVVNDAIRRLRNERSQHILCKSS